MKKKLLALALVFCLVLGMFPTAYAAEAHSGSFGENITWALDESGTLTISGTGPMPNYTGGGEVPWNADSVTSVIVEDGITTVGDWVFSWHPELASVVLPDSITDIGSNAFYHAYQLERFVIPENVTFIGDFAFYANYKLTDPMIPECVISIGEQAFAHCSGLTTVTIPAGVEFIGNAAFAYCTALTDILVNQDNANYANDASGVLLSKDLAALIQAPGAISGSYSVPDGVAVIHDYAFVSCTGLTDVSIPDSVTSIGNHAFSGCTNLTTADLGSGITVIGEYAFDQCASLSSVMIPEGVTMIEYRSFRECTSLTEITIPAGVTEIGYSAFDGCTGLCEVHFLGDAPVFNGDDVFASVTATCYYPAGNDTWNEDVMWNYGGNLTWVAVGDVEPAPTDPTPTEPEPTEPSIPEESEYGGSCGEGIYWTFDPDTGTLSIFGSGTMTTNDYGSPWKHLRDKIVKIDFAPEVTNIGDYAFKALKSLDKVVIPAHIISIGQGAFESCTSLDEVVIRGPVTELRYTFNQCRGLDSVTLPDTVETMVDTFHGCERLETVDLPKNLKVMNNVFQACYNLKEIVVPEGVVDIDGSFWQCWNLTKVDLPDSLENLGHRTFGCCHDLKTVTIPENVKYIGSWAFDWVEVRSKTPTISGVQVIFFTGDSPEFHEEAFYSMNESKITCYYPKNNSTWTKGVLQNYGGNVTWKAYDPAEAGNPFTDVGSSDYFFQPVLWAVDNGITTGISATKFGPNNSCTRAQVVTFLWRAAGEPEPSSTKNPFKDVKASDYFYKAVLWAVEEGITTGMSATSFGPNSPCTRGQVVTFLYRSAGTPESTSGKNPFSDVKSSDFYYNAVLWAVGEGITTGISATNFGPSQTCTRGQVVTFLYRSFTE